MESQILDMIVIIILLIIEAILIYCLYYGLKTSLKERKEKKKEREELANRIKEMESDSQLLTGVKKERLLKNLRKTYPAYADSYEKHKHDPAYQAYFGIKTSDTSITPKYYETPPDSSEILKEKLTDRSPGYVSSYEKHKYEPEYQAYFGIKTPQNTNNHPISKNTQNVPNKIQTSQSTKILQHSEDIPDLPDRLVKDLRKNYPAYADSYEKYKDQAEYSAYFGLETPKPFDAPNSSRARSMPRTRLTRKTSSVFKEEVNEKKLQEQNKQQLKQERKKRQQEQELRREQLKQERKKRQQEQELRKQQQEQEQENQRLKQEINRLQKENDMMVEEYNDREREFQRRTQQYITYQRMQSRKYRPEKTDESYYDVDPIDFDY